KDVTRFGNDVLFPVLVRDAEALGIYKALGVSQAAVNTLKGPRLDIINAINLGRPIPVADGSTGDVITLDAAIDSMFPNAQRAGRPAAQSSFASDFQTVPVMGNTPGFGGATFQTYVAIFNPTASSFSVNVSLYDTAGVKRDAVITLAAGELKTYQNFLAEV